jgi:hypothetical protein
MVRTYGGLIRELGLTPCHGIGPTGHYCSLDHNTGASDPGMVHIVDGPLGRWTDIKRFLLLCARALDLTRGVENEPDWLRVYRDNIAIRTVGKVLHIRVPSRYHRFDKTVVMAGVGGLSNDMPFRKQAYDWARR